MARVIEMPKLSDTMEEGGIANWLKKEGELVKEGEPLVEIETDKATQEYESPSEGVLLKIIAPAGGKAVPLRGPIAVIGEKGEKFDLEALIGKAAPVAKVAEVKPAAKPADAQRTSGPGHDVKTSGPGHDEKAPAAVPAPAASGDRIRSSPLARKVAAERGVNLASVTGSGPGGRVVMKDVEGATAGGAAPPAHGHVGAASRSVPVSMMRKTIAKRLLAAKNEAPHFYLTVSVDMTRANDWRERMNAEAAKAKGDNAPPKVSVNDLVIMAVARALRLHPMVNASWQGDTILINGPVHVAMAVALPEGLVTPVIRDTDRLGVRDIARQSRELASRAKDGKLGNSDYTGGTFTISNLGMLGIEEFTAIINPPQACILAVGTTQVVPWVDANGAIVAQARMKMTMSCDHRVVDGALGAQFLKTLVGYLEEPLNMLA